MTRLSPNTKIQLFLGIVLAFFLWSALAISQKGSQNQKNSQIASQSKQKLLKLSQLEPIKTKESKAMKSQPSQTIRSETQNQPLEIATLAGGCFWCVEADLEKIPGVKKVISGYAGGHIKNPSYKQVSGGETGHVEAVQVHFDPQKISYAQLLEVFWKTINPTDDKGQFVDRGFQYSSAIFYHSPEQKKVAEQSKAELSKKGPFKTSIVTPIKAFENFYTAEDYHQDYYKKNSMKYKFYRWRSGRDQFLKENWSPNKDKPTPQAEAPAEVLKQPDTKSEAQARVLKQPDTKLESSSSQAEAQDVALEQPDTKSEAPSQAKAKNHQNITARVYVRPSDEEIKQKLKPLQYQVTQNDKTEPPFKNAYWDHKEEGIYVDIVSGEPLFSSIDKYDSKTGWPSWTQPIDSQFIVTKPDKKLFMTRTEVRSKYADSHLGHVFNDGPAPTGLRYCINSASLRFIAKSDLKKEGYSHLLALFESR